MQQIATSRCPLPPPLSDGTMLRLADAVLTPDDASRLELLQSASQEDPALAQWCVDSAEKPEQGGLDDPARWLDRMGISQLAAQTDDRSPAATVFRKACEARAKLQQFENQWDEQLLREKLASLKEFTFGASHELNNPLFNISSRAQFLLRDETDPQRRRKLSTIYAHAIRASEMINDIALAARIPKPEFGAVDVVAVVHEVVEELTPLAEEQGTHLHVNCEGASSIIEADALQLTVAVREICINALESLKRTTRRGEITVSVRKGVGSLFRPDPLDSEQSDPSKKTPDPATITVTDNGPGLDQRAKRHLFDPFFSGYEAGRGLGFGLTKCWQIVQAHGGTIVVDSQVGSGCEVTINLPQAHTLNEGSDADPQ